MRLLSVLVLTAAVLFVALYLAERLDKEFIDTCKYSPYQRERNPDRDGEAIIGKMARAFLAFGCVRVIFFILYLLLWSRCGSFWYSTYIILVLVLLYFPGLYICEHFKHSSVDRECHFRSNGISGHLFYTSYVLVCVFFLCGKIARLPPNPNKRFDSSSPLWQIVTRNEFLKLLKVACVTFLGLEGFFTYWYGYHSPRQMFLGAIWGILYSTLVLIIADVPFITRKTSTRIAH